MSFLSPKKYYKSNFTLAYPVILANMGQSFVGIADNMMVGQLGALPLAAASFANVIVLNVLVFGMGMAYSLTPLSGAAFVVGDRRRVASLFQNAISLNIIIGISLTALLLLLMPLFNYMGQDPEVISMSRPYYLYVTASVLPYMMFLSFKQFMEGIGNTKAAMVITIAANVLNIILNYMLIFGKWGAPNMGITGAAVATLISRVMMPIAFYIYIRSKEMYSRYFYFFSWKRMSIRVHRHLLDVGFPISMQMVIEMFALSMTAIMMGWISPIAMAANQIVLSVISFVFMISSGISGTVTILVSHAFGMRSRRDIAMNCKAGIHLSVIIMGAAAISYIFLGRYIAMGFNSDPTVIELAAKMFVIAAIFEIFDGIQVTALGGLRGITDVKGPMVYAIIAYLFINIPCAYLLGFTFNLGVQGVWIGFLFGLATAGVLFINRFFKKVKTIRF